MGKKPLTCPVCKRKFSYSAKTHPMKRMSRHLWSEHSDYMKRKIKSGKKKKSKLRPIDREFMAIDDITLKLLAEIAQGREVEHEKFGGRVLGGMKGAITSPWAILGETLIGQTVMQAKGRVPSNPVAYVVLGKFLYDLFNMPYKDKGT